MHFGKDKSKTMNNPGHVAAIRTSINTKGLSTRLYKLRLARLQATARSGMYIVRIYTIPIHKDINLSAGKDISAFSLVGSSTGNALQ